MFLEIRGIKNHLEQRCNVERLDLNIEKGEFRVLLLSGLVNQH